MISSSLRLVAVAFFRQRYPLLVELLSLVSRKPLRSRVILVLSVLLHRHRLADVITYVVRFR